MFYLPEKVINHRGRQAEDNITLRIAVLLYSFSTKNEIFLLSLLLLKSCSTFNLETFSQVLSTVIEIF